MSIDPGLIRAEPHVEVGLLIQSEASALIERWRRRAVEEQPHAQRVHEQALLDHLYDLIQALGRSLVETEDAATCQHWVLAAVHGEDRWETGWSLLEVVRDYQILRLVILDYLKESLEQSPSHRVVMAVGLALDEAIASSVINYVTSRDEYLRQLEDDRAERDKQIQDLLKQKVETLSEVDRRKSEFLAILGHELRNPLAPLWNAVHIMEHEGSATADERHIQDIIKRQVQQLGRLADDLLDISRIAQNKIELRKELVNVASVVTQAVQMSAPHLTARRHRLEVDAVAESLWVHADPARLVQIVGNILNNAAKYTQPGGSVRLRVRHDGQEVIISVQDNGAGIPSELLPHVFELFTQGEWSADRSQGGMGIGLALVRRLVELHGGTIEAHSAGLGQGSEFVVRLPLVQTQVSSKGSEQQDGKVRRDADAAQAMRLRILAVDDNVDAATSLRVLLRLHNHEVRIAHDGESALQVADEFRPQVILLDIGLPRLDGYEVARRLRARPDMQQVLLVAMTGYGQDGDRQRSQEAGFHAHLVKPVAMETLVTLLSHRESLAREPAI